VFEEEGVRIEHPVEPSLMVNNAEAKYRLVMAGMAIGQFSDYIVAAALERGELLRVLPEAHRAPTLSQFALYPHERHRLLRVSAMIEFLTQAFRNAAPSIRAAASSPLEPVR
jgi:DNA-binding transcriptional LysR family regulator